MPPRWRLLLDGSVEPVLVIEAGRIAETNSAFRALTGWSAAAFDGLPYPAAVFDPEIPSPTEDGATATRRLRRADGRRIAVRVRELGDGSTLIVFLRPVAPGVDTTTETGTLPSAVDDRIRRLEMVKARYRELVEGLSDGLVMTDADGRIAFVNEPFARLLGAGPRRRFIGLPLIELFPMPERARLRRETTRWSRGEVRRFESKLLAADGSSRPVLLAVRALDAVGQEAVRGALFLVTDDEERRAVVERAELARRMDGLASLAGGVAHDFNNLLTGILGHASRIRVRRPEPVIDDEARSIEDSAELASRLTQRMLQLVRGQAPHRRRLDLGAVAVQTMTLVRKLVPEAISLTVSVEANLPPVLADESLVQQAVLNLCINARDAVTGRERPGVVRLSVERGTMLKLCDDGSETAEDAVVLSVMDNGPGIPGALRSRIFEPFFTTKAVGRGTGLGLATVWQLAQAHGGTVQAGDATEGGAKVSLCLPLAAGTAADPVSTASRRVELGRRGVETILLAEDERPIRELVAKSLREHGYTVHAAADGGEAIALWDRHGPEIDLLFLDVRMPVAEGPEVLRHARATRPFVPAVLSSGFIPEGTDPAGATEFLNFLPKPYRVPELLAVVRRTIDTLADAGPATLDHHPSDFEEPWTGAASVVGRAGLTFDGAATHGEIPVVGELAEEWGER